jgi:Sec-independent protein translocase protein TatA
MHFSELLVVIIVAILIFPPKKIPELAQFLGRIIRYIKTLKQEIFLLIQLEDNKKRAEEAEKKA